jgi:large subunit ribosomal protein L10
MAKQEKVEKVRELSERFQRSSGAIFAEYRGLTVKDTLELRRALRDASGSFAVVKNTLTKLAVREAGLDEATADLFEGPMAVAFLEGDAIKGAKALLELTRRFPSLVVKGGLMDGRPLSEADTRSLANIETIEISLAKVAGLLQAPLSRIAYLLQAPLSRIAFALAERGRQGPSPEEPPPAAIEPQPEEPRGTPPAEAASEEAAPEEA